MMNFTTVKGLDYRYYYTGQPYASDGHGEWGGWVLQAKACGVWLHIGNFENPGEIDNFLGTVKAIRRE